MAFRVYGFAELREQVAAYFRSEFPDRDHSESGYFGLLSNALALFLLEMQARLYQIDANWPPTGPGVGGDALRQTETDILDRVAQLLGLPTNQPTAARPYGRDLATAATGGLGLLIGPANTVIPDGSVLTDPSGTLVVLSGAVNLGALGRSTGAFVALTTGPAGNLSLGTVLTFQAPPPGVTPQVTLTSPLVGGATQESDEALLLRIYARFQNPPGAGKPSDYRTWAKVAGILGVFVYPKRGGTGTVHTVLTQAGQGAGRLATAPQIAASLAAVTALRPVTVAGYLTMAPRLDANRALWIQIRVQPLQVGYFDWNDLALTTVSFAAGPPAVVTIQGSLAVVAPSLKQAIANGQAGVSAFPRIQFVCSTMGAPVIPAQLRAVAFVDAAQSQITLQALSYQKNDPLVALQGFVPPSAGDALYAGGLVPPLVAEAGLAHVNSIGPARGKYADPGDPWEDTLYHSRLSQVALDVTSAGLRVLRSAATLIGIGNGVRSSQDVQALDTVANAAPELLYAAHLWVSL